MVTAVEAAPERDGFDFVDWYEGGQGLVTGGLHGHAVTLMGPTDGVTGIYYDSNFRLYDSDDYTPRLDRADAVYIVAVPEGHDYMLSFGAPIQDPVVHLASLESTIKFAQGTVVTKVSGEATFTMSGQLGSRAAAGRQRPRPQGRHDPADGHL